MTVAHLRLAGFASDDLAGGLAAIAEKRKPRLTGE